MNQVWEMLQHYCVEKYVKQLNPIEQLMALDFNELMINNWRTIYLEDSSGIRAHEAVFYSREDYLRHFHAFLAKHNQRVSIDKPIVHFDLAGVFRVSIVHENVTQSDPLITIRKSSVVFRSRQELLSGFATARELTLLEELTAKRETIFISGETSSGKTTLLNYLLQYVPADERLIVIEDTKEIQAKASTNAVYLRTTEQEFQVKELTTSDLVKASLRMRPDRIILGEIRRDEVIDFLHAINTGHHGSLSTGHGNSPQDMVSRLELLLLEAGLPYEAVQRYLGHGIDIIVQLAGKHQRRIDRISRVSYRDGKIRFSDVV
ncbi:MAG TPA: Flp pilus assembly complex ATPase component TadA [Tissierellia bacterium]|nr:Flp pilus assembly complex ATPase component TadA [Tissierellia bacterium]